MSHPGGGPGKGFRSLGVAFGHRSCEEKSCRPPQAPSARLTDPEVPEWRYAVPLESHRINRGSGGKGKHKGGDGTIRRVRFLERMQAALVSNRRKVPPFGLHGGEAGSCGDQWIERADGGSEKLEGRCRPRWGPGMCSRCRRPAAGGTGRDRWRVRATAWLLLSRRACYTVDVVRLWCIMRVCAHSSGDTCFPSQLQGGGCDGSRVEGDC